MKRLLKIAQSATPSAGVQFRGSAYGAAGTREVDRDDVSGKPAYQALANEFIEPPIRIRYYPVNVGGHQLGVYEIADCQDRPYMMRIDHSETLRRGDAYQRVKNAAVKMGRRQLQSMFEAKFRESVSSANIEIGFPGEIIHKDHRVDVCDLTDLPSAIAGSKLRQLIEIKDGISMADDAVQVSSKLGDIPPGEFVDVFEVPLRLCVGAGLQGKRFGMQYSLFAQNLRAPAKGKLRLLF